MQWLITGSRELPVTLSPEHLAAFQLYRQELAEWNAKFNLTAITDDRGVQVRHFLDSLSCVLALRPGESWDGVQVIDVGTGAGFPGLPLKIVYPQMRLTLLEATRKKVRFLEHIVSVLRLADVEIIHGRAEDVGQDLAYREQYDWCLARAVADMPILMEYLLPLVKVGGYVLAQKGEQAPAEAQRSEWAIRQLGGHLRRLVPVELHGLAETRHLVLVDKVAATPSRYPRRPGIPAKRPLRPPA